MMIVRTCPFPECDQTWQHFDTEDDQVDTLITMHLNAEHTGWTVEQVRALADEHLAKQRTEAARNGLAIAIATFMPRIGHDAVLVGEWAVIPAKWLPPEALERSGHRGGNREAGVDVNREPGDE